MSHESQPPAVFIQFTKPPQRALMFDGIKRPLKPGGLLLQGYGLKQLAYKTGGPFDPAHLYTRELLEQAFGDFAALEIREHSSVLAEGSRHVGLSSLIDLIGRK